MSWTGLDDEFAKLEAECTDIIRGLTVRVFNSVLSRTPQFLGRMAASWEYSIGAPSFVDRSDLVFSKELMEKGYYKDSWKLKKGNPAAIYIANAANAGRDKAFKLGDIVYFANGVNHGEGPYAGAVEDGSVRLRSVNLPDAPASRALDWANDFYSDITPNKAETLKSLTIGVADASDDS